MKVCTRCVLPETFQGITFDDNGVCNFCNQFDEKEQKDANLNFTSEEEVIACLKKYKDLNRKYDVLVPLSGGVDSCFTLIRIVEGFKLRPLVFHSDHGWDDPAATANVEKLCKELGVDLLIWKSDWKFMRKLFKYFNESKEYSLSACHVCGNILYLYGLEIAENFNIPLVVNGYSKGQVAMMHDKKKSWEWYGKMIEVILATGDKNFFDQFSKKWDRLERQIIYKDHRDLERDVDPNKILFIPLFVFKFYQTDKAALKKICRERFDWQPIPNSYPARTTNCRMIWLNSYRDLNKRCYTHYHDEYSTLVRAGEMTRDQALKDLELNPPEGLLERLARECDIDLEALEPGETGGNTFLPDSQNTVSTNIGILSPSQYKKLWDFNQTAAPYPRDATIHELFAEQAEKTPDNIAVVFKNSHLSYRQLNESTNQLAGFLKEKGVKPDSIVGLMQDRSLEIAIGQLGILKAGGAFLPLDLETPTNRIVSMLKDCESSLLLTKRNIEPEGGGDIKHSYTALQGLQSGQLLPRVTAPRQPITDFDALPFPNRSLINYEKYNRCIGQAVVKNRILIQAARGCPYNCSYCYRIWPGKQIARSGDNLFKEVKLYYHMGIRKFDIFMMNLNQGRKFFELIIQHRLQDIQLFFPNGFRGDLLTGEYVDLMVEAGTVNVALALETASPRLQKLINKNLDLEKFREIVDYICQTYPQVILELFTMHGIPTETREEARMTLDFIKSFKWIHFPYVNVLKIYHHTDMEQLALQNGMTQEQILRSENMAWHELSDTLPFERNFSVNYQVEFLNDYLLNKERLLHVLPYQMNVLSEGEMVRKYDSYLPADIKRFYDLLAFTGITAGEIGTGGFVDKKKDEAVLAHFNQKLKQRFPTPEISDKALRVLLLDLSQFFRGHSNMLYDVVDVPLGLMYLLTYLNQKMGEQINGKILKPRIDFDSLDQLKTMVEEFQPHVIGVRSLTFYKDFFHETVAALRQRGFAGPIIAGGPYATVDYQTLLQDRNIDLVVIGEGEETFREILEKIIENKGKLPGEQVLREIPGIAFIPGKETNKGTYAREVLMIDHLTDTLSQMPGENPTSTARSSNLAYAIFTSGSTGVPKGVLTQHRNAVNVLKWFGQAYALQPDTHVIQVTNYSFDPSVEQIYSTLLHGATVFIPTRADISGREEFAAFVNRKQINMVNSVPILLKELLAYREKLDSLDIVISGGEKLENPVKNQILEKGYRLYNQYGPTETTIDALMTRCSRENVTLGRPIFNVTCHIVDQYENPVPIGVAGELLIGGAGVCRGYLNRPELTAEKFLYVFYRSYRSYIYRTGDLARWLPDGTIEFLGRIDFQVKIRGFRIELGEIESLLLKHPAVKEVVVMTTEKDKDSGTRYLCAYVKTDQSISNNTSPKQDFIPQLKRYLAEKLPNYMIPSYFVLMDEIPLTSNGKINRNSLPDPKSAAPGSKTTYVKPETFLGQVIAETWQEVLKKNMIDIDDNFFDLGGNSLDFIMMGNQLKEKLNRQIPAVTLFTYPTIRSLERYLNPEQGTEAVPVTDSQSGPSHHPELIEEGKNLMKQTLKKFDPGY